MELTITLSLYCHSIPPILILSLLTMSRDQEHNGFFFFFFPQKKRSAMHKLIQSCIYMVSNDDKCYMLVIFSNFKVKRQSAFVQSDYIYSS